MERLLIKGGTVIPVTGRSDVYENGLVYIEEGRIRFAGAREDAPRIDSSVKTIDATGQIVMPGVINTHCHAGMTLLRGYSDDLRLFDWLNKMIWPAEARLTPDSVYWGSALAAYEMLSGGITTFIDMYFYPSEVARATQDTGIRGVMAPGVIGFRSPEDTRRQLNEIREAYNQWNGKGGGRISFMVGPHAPYTCPEDAIHACMELADDLGINIHIHLSETASEVDQAWDQWNASPIGHVHKLGLMKGRHVAAAHCVHVSDDDITILAETGTGVCHCPVSNLKLASGIAPVAAMRRAGVKVGVGTDGAASDNILHILGSELRLAALLAKNLEGDPEVFTGYDAVEMATIQGARALGMEEEIGSLEPGKRADVILIDTRKPHLTPVHDPVSLVAYSVLPGDVTTTIVDGKVVYQQGGLTLADGGEIMAKAAEAARKLVRG